MNNKTPLLELHSLSSGYGKVKVLQDVSFSVFGNEIVSILGHNGMGKTTLMKTLMGFVPQREGLINWDGHNISSFSTHRRVLSGMGYVPQGRGIFPNLTVIENLSFAYQEHSSQDEEEVVEKILDDFPTLRQLSHREGGVLSGGEQQLLALARALMGQPVLLLLDEPTEGIQPSIIDDIIEMLNMLRQKQGLTILLAEQNFDFISELSDRVLIMERGEIKAELEMSEFLDIGNIEQFLGFGGLRSQSDSLDKGRRTLVSGSDVSGLVSSVSPEVRQQPSSARLEVDAQAQVIHMTIRRPTLSDMRSMADRFGMSCSDEELSIYLGIMEPYIQSYDRIDVSPDNLPEVVYPRSPGYRPPPSENPLNAWYIKTDIKGALQGCLQGKRVVVKDTVCVAGVPMMNGSSVMEGYVPEIDATIVSRILNAGGTIAGKSVCENLCLSGGSHTSSTGPVHNPFKYGYMAGGSSSGSAALVASRDVDMAIGGDQGGSIRIPSFFSGCYGMKPTHGLVPYTGVMPVEQTIDHVGPITNSVADNALLLKVIAGEDGLDPRQYSPQVHDYCDALGKGVEGIRIGIVEQGFAQTDSETDVDNKVLAGIEKIEKMGAKVSRVSIPEHNLAIDLWVSITVEGLQNGMMDGYCAGTNYKGLFLPSMIDHFARWRERSDELSHSLKVCMFIGEYFQKRYRGRYYGKSQNLMRKVVSSYCNYFSSYDILIMPTVRFKARRIPDRDASIEEVVRLAFEIVGNTCPFNVSGFPAMNVPCGMSEGLPVGFMLVANHYNEMLIYRVADAFESLGDWRTF